MKLLFASLITFLAFGSFTGVSAKQTQQIKVQINHEGVARGAIRIKFVDLIEDSRCPTDTQCVWAGNAKIKVELSRNSAKKVVELNTGISPQSIRFEGYEFKVTKLTPAPASNVRIRKDGYVATFTVTKRR
jgi:hypothetical protein